VHGCFVFISGMCGLEMLFQRVYGKIRYIWPLLQWVKKSLNLIFRQAEKSLFFPRCNHLSERPSIRASPGVFLWPNSHIIVVLLDSFIITT